MVGQGGGTDHARHRALLVPVGPAVMNDGRNDPVAERLSDIRRSVLCAANPQRSIVLSSTDLFLLARKLVGESRSIKWADRSVPVRTCDYDLGETA